MKMWTRFLVAGGMLIAAAFTAADESQRRKAPLLRVEAPVEVCIVEVEVDYLEISNEQGSRGALADRREVYQRQPFHIEARTVKAAVREWATAGMWIDPVTFIPPGMIHKIYVEDERGCLGDLEQERAR